MEGNIIDTNGPLSVRVMGIGGTGINILGSLFMMDFNTTEFRRVNRTDGPQFCCIGTDVEHLNWSPVDTKILIDPRKDQGPDAPRDTLLGERFVCENEDEIIAFLDGGEIVFVITGLRGDAEIAASCCAASICRKLGLITTGILIMPFEKERNGMRVNAQNALDKLSRLCDIVLMMSNDVLLKTPTMPSLNAASKATAGLVSGMIDNTLRMKHYLRQRENAPQEKAVCECIQ